MSFIKAYIKLPLFYFNSTYIVPQSPYVLIIKRMKCHHYFSLDGILGSHFRGKIYRIPYLNSVYNVETLFVELYIFIRIV